MVGMCNKAIKIGDVMTPITPKTIPNIPAVYSFCRHASKPSMKANGLNKGDKINIPMKPKIILSVPYIGADCFMIILSFSIYL